MRRDGKCDEMIGVRNTKRRGGRGLNLKSAETLQQKYCRPRSSVAMCQEQNCQPDWICRPQPKHSPSYNQLHQPKMRIIKCIQSSSDSQTGSLSPSVSVDTVCVEYIWKDFSLSPSLIDSITRVIRQSESRREATKARHPLV